MEKDFGKYLQMAQAVGHVVITWSLIDRQVNNWVSAAFNNYGGRSLIANEEMPREFIRKKAFLKDCFKKIGAMNQFKEEGVCLLSRAGNLAKQRNDLVHGYPTDIFPEDGIFAFQIVGTHEDIHTIRDFNFDPSEFPTLEKSLVVLLKDSIAFSEKLISAAKSQP